LQLPITSRATAALTDAGRVSHRTGRITSVSTNPRPWAPAAAEARGAVLTAEGDKEAAGEALRLAIAGYATARQRLNEERARHLQSEHLASVRPADRERKPA
jgi:hypothetical protein